MFHRWLIRAVLLCLLLMCVAAWGLSHRYLAHAQYRSPWYCAPGLHRAWTVYLYPGVMHFTWSRSALDGMYPGLTISITPLERYVSLHDMVGVHAVGFWAWSGERGLGGVGVPFWFLTAVLSGLLWLAWRKARPMNPANAFPVETDGTRHPQEVGHG